MKKEVAADPAVASKIDVGEAGSVSALWLAPPRPTACYVFAHGAGAGMTHPSMAMFAAGLAARASYFRR